MKHLLRRKSFLALTLLIRILIPGSAYGSHTMGADLTYQCLGGNTYQVTLSFYRDCIGIAAPASPVVTINSPSCGQSLSVTCYKRPGTGQEVTPTCSSSVTTCNGGSFTGIQEWVYDGIVTLPAQCTDWTFGYSLCCRNAAITTITTPNSNTFYIYSTLNNTISPCNSSPTFSNKPVPFLCLGQQFCFNHGAYDVDGDSLVYSLITPKQTATTNVNYNAPYNAGNPLNSSPATSFNSVTGDICLTPQALEVTVMAVLVEEYRNGVKIGSVERDLQLTVMNCSNNLPWLTGINGTNNFNITVCANAQTCFDIFSNDPDTGQQLTVNWNYAIPGATFTSGSGLHPTGTFCWTPTQANIGNSYTFTVTVSDDACPYFGSQTYSYTVNVIGINVNAGPDQAVACSDLATLTAIASGGSGTYTYLWSTGQTIQSITAGEGTYWVTASDGSCTATDTVVVTMPFIPVATFTHTNPGCNNSPISFTDLSTTPGGAIVTWNWQFGDGAGSTLQNPTHQYASPGNYTVTLIVENNLGCIDTVSQIVTIQPPIIAQFAANATCVNSSVSFTDQSTGSPVTWSWQFGDGNTSVLQNPNHTYLAPGTYNVTLITTNTQGCIDTLIQLVTIYPLPLANAGANQNICTGSSVTLNATGGVSYNWIPIGQSGSTITFTPGSSSQVIVQVTDLNGCIAYDTVNVNLLPLPTVNAGTDQSICSGSATTLTATGANSYTWSPGGLTTSTITVNPTSTTTYTVIGTATNGCTSSDAVVVSTNSLPVANAGPDVSICSGSTASLTASGGLGYVWSPGGATTPSINVSPATTQTYVVTVSNGAGCTSTDAVVVHVNQRPVVNLQSFFLCIGSTATLDAGNPGSSYLWNTGQTTQTISINSGGIFSVTVTDINGCTGTASTSITYDSTITINLGNVSFCQGDSVLLDAGYPGMTYLWTPGGETTQTIYVNNSGTYGVTVTDSTGCSGSISVSAVANPTPQPNFSSPSVCQGNPMSFTDGSTITSGSINGWNWDFGDGNTSTIQNPTHTYATSGNYNVLLTATSAAGCSSSISRSVTVNPLPAADFNFSNSCLGGNVSFTDASVISTGNITGYNWNFGDGNTSTQQNPSHLYSTPGNYTVTLQVVSGGGCIHAISKTVTIHPLPVAAFNSTIVCQGNPTAFNNTSSISTGSISSYNWDFNDTYTSNQNSPSHTYAAAGNYSVKLIVTSSNGCMDTLVQNVLVNSLPVVNAGTNQSVCSGNSLTLTATSTDPLVWNPGGYTANSIVVSPVTSTTYSVTATNSNGCTSTDAVSVNVLPLPNANAGSDQVICSGNTISLNATGGISYLWTPGGMTSSNISVQPLVSTTYYVNVTNTSGCSDVDTVQVSVLSNPMTSAGPDQDICQGSTVSLTATGALTYSWSPGGSVTPSILVSPNTTTSYIVTGTSANGCTNSDTVQVIVRPAPMVNMSTALLCDGSTVTLDAGNPGCTYSWSTGETTQTISVSDSGNYSVVVTGPNLCPTTGNVSVVKAGNMNAPPAQYQVCNGNSVTLDAGNPGFSYYWSTGQSTQQITVNNTGNYFVTITDTNGCAATLEHRVTINPIPTATFSTNPGCRGSIISFIGNPTVATGSIQQVQWDFGDGSTGSGNNVQHTYSASGNFPVTMTATSDAGCTATESQTIDIYPTPSPAFVTQPGCQNETVSFSNQSTVSTGTITGWNWNSGDGSSSSSINYSHQYASAGIYNVTLTVTTDHGCVDSITNNVTIYDLPVASFQSANACAGSSITFTNHSVSGGSPLSGYAWSFGNGNTSGAFEPVQQFNTAGTYSVFLIVTAANGCSDTVSSPVEIYPVPNSGFNFTPVCNGSPVNFQDGSTLGSGTIANYYWDFGDNSISSVPSTAHQYATAGTYTVSLIVSSDFGCVDTVTQPVTVYPQPLPSFTSQDVCNGNQVNFQNTSSVSTGSITQWYWNFNDNTTSNLANPGHIFSTPGTYSVSLTATTDNGCQSTVNNSVNVFPVPSVSFSTVNVCIGNTTQFLNQTALNGGGNFSSHWDFGDGDSTLVASPVHTYQNAGTYPVTLSVITANGCSGQYTSTVDVYRLPVARFAAPDNCAGTQIQFNNQSYSQDGQITSTFWSFGDGNYSIDPSPSHAYADSGKYDVELQVITSYGCMDSHLDSISSFANPEVYVQVNNSCAGGTVSFSGSSNLTAGMNYSWMISNGSSSNAPSFSQSFYTPGNYHVTLTATTTDGCSGNVSQQFVVHPVPVADFTSNEVCEDATTQFENNSFIPSGQIQSYSWDFGDNQQSTNSQPVHTYNSWGIYNATLTTVSNQGCSSIVTRQVRIHPKPIVSFNAGIQGCSPVNAFFNENSSIPEGSIASWLWNFGDGEISTERFSSHLFTNSGTYDATLTAVSDFGCVSSYSQNGAVTVYPQPTADFTADPLVTDLQMPIVHFYNQSQDYISYQWIFSDGSSTSTELNPTHTFADTGTYIAKLITVNSQGCTDTIQKKIEVKLHSTLWIANCFTPNGDGNNDVFRPFHTNMEEVKVWIFDRWGKMLTSWNGLEGYWDGYYEGRKCQQDTYVYKIDGTGLDGKHSEWVGHVSIVY